MKSTPRVLIVDDMPMNIKLLEAHLSLADLELDSAADGVEALEKVNIHPPDLILLDVMMPKLDGFEVCRRLKENEHTRMIPIVLVTALDNMEDRVKGIDSGADDFLSKPINKVELLARTRALLKTKKLNDKVLSLQGALKSLFEITTFSESYTNRQHLLNEFSRHCALMTGASKLVVVLRQAEGYALGGTYRYDENEWNAKEEARMNLVGTVLDANSSYVIGPDEKDRQEEFQIEGGFLGVPLLSYTGTVLGIIAAFGIADEISEEMVRVLSITAQRISSELQIQDYSQHLESLVDERTEELKEVMEDLQNVNEDLRMAHQESIFRLAKAAEYRDEDTHQHIIRMSNYCYMLARKMGYEQSYCERMRLASIMHDVGKLGIPDSILQKRGKLSAEEFSVMKEHTLIGAKILSGSNSGVLQMSEAIALCHHEKWDGSGYPHGLIGRQIPLEARIVAIADVFDALTTRRVYKPAFSVEDSLDYIREQTGTHFDPEIAERFFEHIDSILEIKNRFPDN